MEAGGTSTFERSEGLGLDRLWILVAVAVPAFVALAATVLVIDLAYLIRAGEWTLDGHGILRQDVFTYSVAGSAWFNQQWAAEVLLAAIFRLGGWPLLVVTKGLLVGGIAALTVASCRARGATPRSAALLSLGGFLLSMPAFALRPQLVAAMFFALVLWAVTTATGRPNRLWIVPIVTLAWANVHGSFFFGPLLLGLAYLDVRRRRDVGTRRLVGVGAATLLATCITPYGPAVWPYVVRLSFNDTIRNFIAEWQPLTLKGYDGFAFFASVLAVVFVIWRWSGRVAWYELLGLAAFFLIALPARRGLLWWGLYAPVVVAGIIPAGRERARGDAKSGSGSPKIEAAIAIGLLGLVIAALPWWRPNDPVTGTPSYLRFAPERLVQKARDALPEGSHVFVTQPYASWFELSAPDMPVFLDARIELFPPELWKDYGSLQIVRDDWAEVLDRWNMDVVVLEPDWDLADRLRDDPGWHLVYEDDDGTVFARDASG